MDKDKEECVTHVENYYCQRLTELVDLKMYDENGKFQVGHGTHGRVTTKLLDGFSMACLNKLSKCVV